MKSIIFKYASESVRLVILQWGQEHSVNVEEILSVHIEQKFPARTVLVQAVVIQNDLLVLTLCASCWEKTKEFALSAEGSLYW